MNRFIIIVHTCPSGTRQISLRTSFNILKGLAPAFFIAAPSTNVLIVASSSIFYVSIAFFIEGELNINKFLLIPLRFTTNHYSIWTNLFKIRCYSSSTSSTSNWKHDNINFVFRNIFKYFNCNRCSTLNNLIIIKSMNENHLILITKFKCWSISVIKCITN